MRPSISQRRPPGRAEKEEKRTIHQAVCVKSANLLFGDHLHNDISQQYDPDSGGSAPGRRGGVSLSTEISSAGHYLRAAPAKTVANSKQSLCFFGLGRLFRQPAMTE
jgi:hypothetical protein